MTVQHAHVVQHVHVHAHVCGFWSGYMCIVHVHVHVHVHIVHVHGTTSGRCVRGVAAVGEIRRDVLPLPTRNIFVRMCMCAACACDTTHHDYRSDPASRTHNTRHALRRTTVHRHCC